MLMSFCKTLTGRSSEIIKKSSDQTSVGFGQEKGCLFFTNGAATDARNSFESLYDLMLLEDFKNALPEKMMIFLNEQNVTTLSKSAILEDEIVLTHKNVFVIFPP